MIAATLKLPPHYAHCGNYGPTMRVRCRDNVGHDLTTRCMILRSSIAHCASCVKTASEKLIPCMYARVARYASQSLMHV